MMSEEAEYTLPTASALVAGAIAEPAQASKKYP